MKAAHVKSPTIETYQELQRAYDHFNKELFDNTLPLCLITLQRDKATLGYFSAERFARHSGELSDEIAMNPSYFAVRGIKDTLSTLAHEQVHLWQKHYGKSGRGRYHNQQWAERMIAIGLRPTHNGKPGGNTVGEHMDHIILPGGPFEKSFERLVTAEYRISWYDRFLPRLSRLSALLPAGSSAAPGPLVSSDVGSSLLSALVPPDRKAQTRAKYTCPSCETNVWGKPGLNILCGDCDTALEESY
jgi:predicted SprT family Zn-dependent metalloprotease